jgi:hypothetical protein
MHNGRKLTKTMILAAKDQGYSCVEAVATKFTSRANDIGF